MMTHNMYLLSQIWAKIHMKQVQKRKAIDAEHTPAKEEQAAKDAAEAQALARTEALARLMRDEAAETTPTDQALAQTSTGGQTRSAQTADSHVASTDLETTAKPLRRSDSSTAISRARAAKAAPPYLRREVGEEEEYPSARASSSDLYASRMYAANEAYLKRLSKGSPDSSGASPGRVAIRGPRRSHAEGSPLGSPLQRQKSSAPRVDPALGNEMLEEIVWRSSAHQPSAGSTRTYPSPPRALVPPPRRTQPPPTSHLPSRPRDPMHPPGRKWATARRAANDAAMLGHVEAVLTRSSSRGEVPPGMPPGFQPEASGARRSVRLSPAPRGDGTPPSAGVRRSHAMQACGADVRSAVQTPSRAKIGVSQLRDAGSGGVGDGGEGGSPIFSAMLAAKFGATLQQDAERRRRLASSSPTLSSPTHSAPPSPPQSPSAEGSSLGESSSGRSRRFSLSRPARNSNSSRTSTASSEPEASPAGPPAGAPAGALPALRRPGGLTRQATVGRLSHAAHEAAQCVSHAAHNVSHVAHEAGHTVSHAAHNVSHVHVAHPGGSVRARLTRQKTSSAIDAKHSPKGGRRASSSTRSLLGAKQKLTPAEGPC